MKHLLKVNTMPTASEFMSVIWEVKKPYAGLTIDNKDVFYNFNLPKGYVLAKDSDFERYKNAWHYIGTADKVAIPHTIKGKKVTSYKYMFYQTNVSGVYSNNPNVTDMSYMFRESKANSLDLAYLDTIKVTNMRYMFAFSQAKSLDLSNFDTSNVTNMSVMFYDSKATKLNLSSFNTSKVTDMGGMFNMSQVNNLDLSNFDTSSVTNMSYMFKDSKVKTLDLSSFNTSKVTNTDAMFMGAKTTEGYARTQNDTDKFNSSTYEPPTLKFIVKP